jgi:hypothetical protein
MVKPKVIAKSTSRRIPNTRLRIRLFISEYRTSVLAIRSFRDQAQTVYTRKRQNCILAVCFTVAE